ncbi:type IV pilus assembly protein PilN [Gammaproteobacteria bacterium]
MIRINLLPWRAEKRRERQRTFFKLLIFSVTFTVSSVSGTYLYYQDQIEFQKCKNKKIEKENLILDKKITEVNALQKEIKDLKVRMERINALQMIRHSVVRLFDEIPRIFSEGIYITFLQQTEIPDPKGDPKEVKTLVKFNGIAESNYRISTLMSNIGNPEYSKSVTDPDLKIVQQNERGKDRLIVFELEVKQVLVKNIGEKKQTVSR